MVKARPKPPGLELGYTIEKTKHVLKEETFFGCSEEEEESVFFSSISMGLL